METSMAPQSTAAISTRESLTDFHQTMTEAGPKVCSIASRAAMTDIGRRQAWFGIRTAVFLESQPSVEKTAMAPCSSCNQTTMVVGASTRYTHSRVERTARIPSPAWWLTKQAYFLEPPMTAELITAALYSG